MMIKMAVIYPFDMDKKERIFTLNDGTKVTIKSMSHFENDTPMYNVGTKGWFIPTKNMKEGDFFILNGVKYIFKARSKDGKTDIFLEER
jgi:hypothetical protein